MVPFSNPKSVSLVNAWMDMSTVQEKIQSRIVQFWIVLSKIKSWRKDNVVQLVNWTFAHVVMIAIQNWQIVSMVFRTILVIVNKASREMVPIVKVWSICGSRTKLKVLKDFAGMANIANAIRIIINCKQMSFLCLTHCYFLFLTVLTENNKSGQAILLDKR